MKWHKVGDEIPKDGQLCLCKYDENYDVCEFYQNGPYPWTCLALDESYRLDAYEVWISMEEVEESIESET